MPISPVPPGARRPGRPRTRDTFRLVLATLPRHPAPEELSTAVERLHALLSRRSEGLKSLALYRRHHHTLVAPELWERLEDALRERLADDFEARLAARTATLEQVGQAEAWLSPEDYARAVGLHLRTVYERLAMWEGRRRLGWPVWDGHRWLIAPAVADPARCAAFLSALPAREPLADLLPPHCTRQPEA
jgi:hypothetical protein